ncbi:MAG: hypothetical protein AAGD25_14615 [Cyanobacteria bacterium P01_F01_bin.150]
MPNLPVQRMVLYKHGVGFFERFGALTDSNQVELTFKKEEMNDVLKSLAAFPQGDGQVVTISYETPEDKQAALAKAPIRLSQDEALLDLLRSLRGRKLRLHLTDVESSLPELQGVHTAEDEVAIAGILIGIDVLPISGAGTDANVLADTLVSIQTSGDEPDSHPVIRAYKLGQVRGVDVLDDQSGDDLRYVLELSRANADKRSVTILLNQPNQELLVSYIAPTPTWRVSYRLVFTPAPASISEQADAIATTSGQANAAGKIFLQGWGIVDNQLDEDLNNVELTLIAGQPISFIYDLYTPKLIKRPTVKDEERTVAGPIMFEEALDEDDGDEDDGFMMMAMPGALGGDMESTRGVKPSAPNLPGAKKRSQRRDMAAATQVKTEGVAKGELFQYDVGNPVTIKRGQSAMVPIISMALEGEKAHIYNGEKMPHNPVVTLTAPNASGLTLERGPVTVMEGHNYVGEAVMAFTPAKGELFVPYAVDLGVRVTENSSTNTETAAIRLGQGYLIHDRYHIATLAYTIENRNPDPIYLIIEQRIKADYTLFDTPDPIAKTPEFYRWSLTIPPRSTHTFTTKARHMVSRHEQLKDWSDRTLQAYFQDKLIDQAIFDRLKGILDLYQTLAEQQRELEQLRHKRDRQLKEQTQTAQKLENLNNTGEEGKLRQRFVSKMGVIEDECDRLLGEIHAVRQTQQDLQSQIETALETLGRQ